jgi:hypothetical protein
MLATKSGLAFLRQPLSITHVSTRLTKAVQEESLLPDWNKKITSFVNLRIEESAKKQKEDKESTSSKEQIEKLVAKELKKEIENYERQGFWNCPYCDKVAFAEISDIRGREVRHESRKLKACQRYDIYSQEMRRKSNDEALRSRQT